jgi:transcriptional regulator with XRE-family HTH domain
VYDPSKMAKLQRKLYRDAYLREHNAHRLAYQIRSIRQHLKLSQSEFASKTGKKQSVVARLENPDYGKYTLETLLEIAQSLDIALLVQFTSWTDYLKRSADVSSAALNVDSIGQEIQRYEDFSRVKTFINPPMYVVQTQSTDHIQPVKIETRVSKCQTMKFSEPRPITTEKSTQIAVRPA